MSSKYLGPAERKLIAEKWAAYASVREIAEILELSEAAVKTRLSRARGKLKNTLKGEYASAGTV